MQNHIGHIIQNRLDDLGKTQKWLAEQAGVSANSVNKWVKTGKVARENVSKAAAALGLSADELLGHSGGQKIKASPAGLALMYVDEEEIKLLTHYREADAMGRALIEVAAANAPKRKSADLDSSQHSNNR